VVGGLVVGGADWVAEAYVRWGGVGARLHAASGTEGGMRMQWAGGLAWRSLNGPLLCRPCHVPLTRPELTLWWLALPVLALTACVVARRTGTGRPAVTLLPVACAAALSVPYLLLIGYSAPRFLLPTYALLSLPLATLGAHAVQALHRPRTRALATGLLGGLLALHLSAQFAILHHQAADARAFSDRYRAAAHDLRRLGLTAPCLVSGKHAPPIGYYAGCASANVRGNNRNTTVRALLHRAERVPTAALVRRGSRPPHYARGWTAQPLPGTGLTAYVHPTVRGPR
jgi:hypothetical protein